VAYDRAMTAIEEARKPPPLGDGEKPFVGPTAKKRRSVEMGSMWSGKFIETQEEVDAFLSKLRDELESAIKANERVQIK